MGQVGHIFNFDLIVKDYIRTLKLPKEKSKNPVAVLLVGIPASGKSYLAKNLASVLPLAMISENDIQSFLVPQTSFFERGGEIVNAFEKEVVKELVKRGFNCILDTNLKSAEIRKEFKQSVEGVDGKVVVIYLNCSKKAAYNRIRKRNLEIVTGESEGFILDWNYFQYEINTIEPPLRSERALTFDSSRQDHQFERIVAYLKRKMA